MPHVLLAAAYSTKLQTNACVLATTFTPVHSATSAHGPLLIRQTALVALKTLWKLTVLACAHRGLTLPPTALSAFLGFQAVSAA